MSKTDLWAKESQCPLPATVTSTVCLGPFTESFYNEGYFEKKTANTLITVWLWCGWSKSSLFVYTWERPSSWAWLNWLKEKDTLSEEETFSKWFYLWSEKNCTLKKERIGSKRCLWNERIEKGSSLKEQNLLPLGANSFLLEEISFQFVPFKRDTFS